LTCRFISGSIYGLWTGTEWVCSSYRFGWFWEGTDGFPESTPSQFNSFYHFISLCLISFSDSASKVKTVSELLQSFSMQRSPPQPQQAPAILLKDPRHQWPVLIPTWCSQISPRSFITNLSAQWAHRYNRNLIFIALLHFISEILICSYFRFTFCFHSSRHLKHQSSIFCLICKYLHPFC
jgi:hypothetical protein